MGPAAGSALCVRMANASAAGADELSSAHSDTHTPDAELPTALLSAIGRTSAKQHNTEVAVSARFPFTP